MKEKILEQLRKLRAEAAEDAALAFAAQRSVDMVQAYCNVKEVPAELESVCVALALAVYDGAEGLESIKEGNVSLEFYEKKEGELLLPFREELDRFRKAGW